MKYNHLIYTIRIMKISTLLFVCTFLFSQVAVAQNNIKTAWGSTNVRYAPNEKPQEVNGKTLLLTAWKGERINAQFVVWNEGEKESSVTFAVSDLSNAKGDVIPQSHISGGFVETVLADEFSGCGSHAIDKYGEYEIADRISKQQSRLFAPSVTRGGWLTIKIPQETPAGSYRGTITIESEGAQTQTLKYTVKVIDHTLPEPAQWAFHLDLWQNPYAIARVHKVELWSKEHFDAMRPYMEELASAGQKVITATLIDRPWNGQTYDPFGSMVTWIKKANGEWMYDFTIFDMWVQFMMDCGITKEITCFSMIPWKLSFQYYDQASNSNKEVKAAPGEELYNTHWGNMLEAFCTHLKQKGWFDITCIAMDERSMEQMQKAIKLIHDRAPGLKISLAGSYHPEIKDELYDYCVGEVDKQFTPEEVERRRSEGKITTYYTCCSSHRPNTFTFSAPAEAEFLGWYAQQKGLDGFLRWAYNSWTIDPVKDSRFSSWSAGDTYLVYPQAETSVRWERLVEGIQSFEKFNILKKEATEAGNKSQLSKLDAILRLIDASKLEHEVNAMVDEAKRRLNKL